MQKTEGKNIIVIIINYYALCRAQIAVRATKIKKQVEEAREVAAERQEIVKKYMKMREEQMRRDACVAREELNARVIEVCN